MADVFSEVHGSAAAGRLAEQVWPCYLEVFGDFEDFGEWRSGLFERHAGRTGYRLVTAMDGPTVVGFAWAYVGERGQYWSDLAWEALPDDVAAEWIGGHFEVVELAVLASYRGQGLGRVLHDRLLDGVTQRCLLSTADDPDDPAVHLYRNAGWRKIGILRPGVQIMGLRP